MKRTYQYNTNLHVWRARKRLNMFDLAEAVGLTRQTISNIENTQVPTLQTAMLISQYFGVSVEEIFWFEEII